MEKLSLNTLREEFLKFFESKGHLRMDSFSLIPHDDPSILLINAGMTPFKEYFTGAKSPPRKRIATCQKCIRTIDIERVGVTTRHGTFFEMLGNFSFGDYFKKEAIEWSWEFLTDVLKIPTDLLHVSVYEEDDEAYEIWEKIIGVPKDHIVRLGKEDNFWEHGIGPCGPCSEIYFDHGPERGCGSKECTLGCDCDRFVEVWNNVFTQFDKKEDGSYVPLEHKNIDTGMGLERLACVVQGVDSLFEVDTIKEILDAVCSVTDTKYGINKSKDISIRVITDHIRSAVMMISDGIIPSNESRGYVLRRLLRRASRHARILGMEKVFLADLIEVVIENSKVAYPELVNNKEYIYKVVQNEEEKFLTTLGSGMSILNEYLDSPDMKSTDVLDGEVIFKLHDTYGFPYDLTKEIAIEKGFTLDKKGFDQYMEAQKEAARTAQKNAESSAWKSEAGLYAGLEKTIFDGYAKDTVTAVVKAVELNGDNVEIVTDRTVFYAHGGGQISDTGTIENDNAFMDVTECVSEEGIYIHRGIMKKGSFNKGDTVKCTIDIAKRRATEKNHTATHLLQHALITVLGKHVHQAGSFVDDKRLRFDFTHFSAMTQEQIDDVQKIVNDLIQENIKVTKRLMPMSEAKEVGATALFGEKYEDTVRVVAVEPYSMELCGGTHLDYTGQTGLFKVASESAVASGIRRIEALSGNNALEFYENKSKTVDLISEKLKTSDIAEKVDSMQKEIRELKKETTKLKDMLASSEVKDVLGTYEQIGDIKIVNAVIKNADMTQLRSLADKMRERYENAVGVFGSDSDKPSLIIAATKSACNAGVDAAGIIKKSASLIGGSGGGRPDMAQAGGKDPRHIDKAIAESVRLIKEVLEK